MTANKTKKMHAVIDTSHIKVVLTIIEVRKINKNYVHALYKYLEYLKRDYNVLYFNGVQVIKVW